MNSSSLSVLLLAGGKGSRMGGSLPKQYYLLAGKPVIEYSLEVFLSLPYVREVIIVSDPSHQEKIPRRCDPRISFAHPGRERQDSVAQGLKSLQIRSPFVAIHDSPRPFIDPSLVDRVFADARRVGAACPALPLHFTIKRAKADRRVLETPRREQFWEIQTPQIIRLDWLEEGIAHAALKGTKVTDDVSFVESLGYPVHLSEGSRQNRKLTDPIDLLIAEEQLKQREPSHAGL